MTGQIISPSRKLVYYGLGLFVLWIPFDTYLYSRSKHGHIPYSLTFISGEIFTIALVLLLVALYKSIKSRFSSPQSNKNPKSNGKARFFLLLGAYQLVMMVLFEFSQGSIGEADRTTPGDSVVMMVLGLSLILIGVVFMILSRSKSSAKSN